MWFVGGREAESNGHAPRSNGDAIADARGPPPRQARIYADYLLHALHASHTLQARIYAEKPEAGFLPGSGTLHHLSTPVASGETYVAPEVRASTAGHAVRIDSGVVQGDEVGGTCGSNPIVASRGPGPHAPAAGPRLQRLQRLQSLRSLQSPHRRNQ